MTLGQRLLYLCTYRSRYLQQYSVEDIGAAALVPLHDRLQYLQQYSVEDIGTAALVPLHDRLRYLQQYVLVQQFPSTSSTQTVWMRWKLETKVMIGGGQLEMGMSDAV